MPDIRIEVRPRIHLGLLSMHSGAPRINGGIGFAIDHPVAHIDVREASATVILDLRDAPMTGDEQRQLAQSLERFMGRHALPRHAQIRISGTMSTHVGMGSGTALRLGALEALALMNDMPANRDELIAASGRGGTSGIGINSYFSGGLICDLGRASDGQDFLPSSATPSAFQPLALPAVPLPAWPMLLCVPSQIKSKTQAEELDFFARTAPLLQWASFEASYVALFQLYASAIEADYLSFCRGVTQIQGTAWKRAEREEYGQSLEGIAAALTAQGADCVGMSSLGPMLFCFAPAELLPELRRVSGALGCISFETFPANRGREITLCHA